MTTCPFNEQVHLAYDFYTSFVSRLNYEAELQSWAAVNAVTAMGEGASSKEITSEK